VNLFGRSKTQDISRFVRTLQGRGIQVSGPYRRRNGIFVYSLANRVVTESELWNAQKSEKLNVIGELSGNVNGRLP
jgi:hypothetical protein